MKADVWRVVGGALVVLAVVVGVLVDRYLCAVYWWPLVGTEWRAERAEPHQGSDRAPENARPLTVVAPDGLQTGQLDEDDAWADEFHVMNAELHDEQQEQAPPGRHPIYADLSDDPDLIVWDAQQQAKRCWEIVHIEFPRLRTLLLAEYAVAA